MLKSAFIIPMILSKQLKQTNKNTKISFDVKNNHTDTSIDLSSL